jgi:quercetin dioxygenase-like cupin family protein
MEKIPEADRLSLGEAFWNLAGVGVLACFVMAPIRVGRIDNSDVSMMDAKRLNQKIKEDGMSEQTGTPKGKAFSLENHIEYADNSVVSKTLIKKEIGNITLFAFDKGQGLSEHTAPFDAVVHILDGKAEITIGGDPQIVRQGEMLIMPANISHALQAIEQFKMVLIMIRSD